MAFNYREYQTGLESTFHRARGAGGSRSTQTANIGAYKLDPSRSWKLRDEYATGIHGGHGAASFGTGYKHIGRSHGGAYAGLDRTKYGTGVYDMYSYQKPGYRAGTGTIGKTQILDWTAYDKDSAYRGWLVDKGKKRFESISDILAAEKWMSQPKQKIEKYDDSKLQGRLDKLKASLSSYSTVKERNKLLGALDTRLFDLESKNWHIGDIEGLESQLDRITKTSRTGDQIISELMGQYQKATTEGMTQLGEGLSDLSGDVRQNYVRTADYERTMAQNLKELGLTLEGKWGQDIAQLDIPQVRRAIEQQGGNLQALTRDFAGLQAAGIEGQALDEKERALLRSQIEEGLSTQKLESEKRFGEIDKAFTESLTDVRSDLTSEISQQGRNLSGQIATAREQGEEAIRDVYSTRAEQLGRMQSDWGQNLQAQEELLSGRIEAGDEALNKRLTDLSQTMNYRMLGDSALGIKSRRSEAYRSGSTRAGTGQLSRGGGMKISTLNIA